MKLPKLDKRSREELRLALKRLAQSYTPEWRWEETENDPGAALAELFCDMHYETVERMNALPEKLYLEFLREIGFREPDPSSGRGVMCFTPHPSLEEPVPIPPGTQVFTTDENGDNIVYETTHVLETTSATLRELYYVDGERDLIRRIGDFSAPRRLFDPLEGEEVQRHCVTIGQNEVLRLSEGASVTLRVVPPAAYLQEETAKRLAQKNMAWYYFREGEKVPFDAVRTEAGSVVLEKRGRTPLEPLHRAEDDESGVFCLCCEGRPEHMLLLERVELSSAPLEPRAAQAVFSGDIPISPAQGGACFTRRPAPYSMLYLRSDEVLSKKHAKVMLRLELSVQIDEPPEEEEQYEYGPNIIELQSQPKRQLDDVFVSGVLWEYFNGLGWRELAAEGDVNPFSGKEGSFALRFTVPEDLEETEVNAQQGFYLRARVTEVEHLESLKQRWLVPFLRSASLTWQYAGNVPGTLWLCAENNGERHELQASTQDEYLNFPAFSVLDPADRAIYFRFDVSPHAMPLSLRFLLREGPRMEKLQWEAWTGSAFVPVQCLDETENLSRAGAVYLYLPEPLPERELFGKTGCWLRLSSGAERGERFPTVQDIQLNTVEAVQKLREPEQFFDTDSYEAGKVLRLLSAPLQRCEVWVDEKNALSDTEALAMAASGGKRVELEMEGHRVRRCWVLWKRTVDLSLSGPEDRVYDLDACEGLIRFGDGKRGKVPPVGDHNIRVRYTSGGGARGNVPAGSVTGLLEGLPLISTVENVTDMSGGTERWSLERIEELGNRRLRHQGRAASMKDYEDIVLELFPRVRHVRCFSGRNAEGRPASGEVTVVLAGDGERGESMESLCREVKAELSRRCSCCLVAENRLHVRPARVLTVNTTVLIEVEQPDYAARTQQEIAARVDELIRGTWQSRNIGEQLNIREIWSRVRETRNVRLIRRILADGAFDENGVRQLVALEQDSSDPYAVVTSGLHVVRIV